MISLWGHWVARVQRVQKVLPAFGRRVQRVWWRLAPQILKKGARLCRGLCRRVASLRSGGDSACGAEGGGLPLCGNAYKVSVTGFTFSVIWHSKHYGNQPPPVSFPPFGALRHHLPPAERWDNKDPHGISNSPLNQPGRRSRSQAEPIGQCAAHDR
ncbi:hypothetical protein HMPREF9453_01285 [Dialister succinatiphilus YIT 11850]|uniref:Uncharacterized protein n=1 Tax=Dialister succinatiphilus YIT 11850 TaxID=742743 RepID=H1D0Z7_9FIRM|nr:hypothetical protein HMPREF9453_01285 [Dialister succinatiphilus YIT 11850]